MASNLDDKKGGAVDPERASIEAESFGKGDILQLEHTDPVLNAKMHLVNNVSTTDILSASAICCMRMDQTFSVFYCRVFHVYELTLIPTIRQLTKSASPDIK